MPLTAGFNFHSPQDVPCYRYKVGKCDAGCDAGALGLSAQCAAIRNPISGPGCWMQTMEDIKIN